MAKNLELFFSNQLEILYQQLKSNLFGSTTLPFMRRIVVIYGPAMKTWLMLRMAQDPDLNIAAGIEFLYLSQAFEHLLSLSTQESSDYLPSFHELALAIEKELTTVIHNFNNLTAEEQEDWSPLTQYLKYNPLHLNATRSDSSYSLSRKIQNRLISLSQQLARFFQDYGRFAPQMVAHWELPTASGWQPRLWRQLFKGEMNWSYPAKVLSGYVHPPRSFTVHFFSISFVSACEFAFLNRLSHHVPIYYYLLSPCAVFWSDIRSDRESAYLQAQWGKKEGMFSPKIRNLEELLSDRNPLLANIGRMGREMATQIEESLAVTQAHYVLPEHVKILDEELFLNEDLFLTETKKPLSLLHAIQADLLVMRNPQGVPPIELEDSTSIQLHIASNKRREVEILYHNLLHFMTQDPSLCPSDIIVMAPQINDYVPYIQRTFGINESLLDFQILDLAMHTKSEIVQGFLQLIKLSESRWDASNLLQLFEQNSFQRRHHLTTSDYLMIREWIEQTGTCWGENEMHRNELLKRSHCEEEMVERTEIGTWDYGLSRLLIGLTTVVDKKNADSSEVPPSSMIDFSQGELLGKWIQLLHSLRDDLSLLENQAHMTMEDWVLFLGCLLESYFQPAFDDPQSVKEYNELKEQFEILRHSARYFKETVFSFTTVKAHLLLLLQEHGMTYRENHLQAVRFCSLTPLRSIPAKGVVLMGMQEGAFPRSEQHSSLNLMLGSQETDYCPKSVDYDRYLFLEALHSAQDFFLLSYLGYSLQDNKELHPSLIVEELISYIDQYYTFQGKKFSEASIFKHPFDPFDQRYFITQKGLKNFSSFDFNIAKTFVSKQKLNPHRFLNEFIPTEHPDPTLIENHSQIDIRQLAAVARNPIKFYLNKVLEIYIETEEERQLKTEEELIVSSLDKHQIKHFSLRESIDTLLYQAEREGKLPFGLFKTIATKRIKEDVKEIHESLLRHSIHPNDIFQIEFCTSCSTPIQIKEDRWLYPAVSLTYEDGYQISIVGELPYVTSKGLITLSKGTLSDVWKVWPQFLLYCHAAHMFPEKFEPQLILAQSSQPKRAFFNTPEDYLKQFINYYARCQQNFSPLLPDWLSLILENDGDSLQEKMKSLFSESFGTYPNVDLRWILNKQHLPSSEILIQYWKPQAEELLGDLTRFWFEKI